MLLIALGLGLLTALANILGSYLAGLPRHASRPFMAGVVGFGGGFLLGAALLEMLPETLERRPGAAMPVFVGLGYLLIFVIEQLLNVHVHRLPEEELHEQSGNPVGHRETHLPRTEQTALIPWATGLAALVAFNIHDFLDGLAIGASMVASTELGLLVFLAVVLHEVPAGAVVGGLMLASGRSRRTALLAGASIGIVTLVGIAIPFGLGEVSPYLADTFLALATGTFIYVGATILIPLSEAGRSRLVTLSVVLGFAAFYLTERLVTVLFGE